MMILRVVLKRFLCKRRLFVAFTTVLTVSIMYLCYQALSIHKLGEELSAEHNKRKDFHNSFQSYQKADFPMHLFTRKSEDDPSRDGISSGNIDHGIRIKGVLNDDIKRYIPNSRGNFKCIRTNEEVPYQRVNDNYCDCKDSSDEPSTSACQDGRFYCGTQPPGPTNATYVLSSRVNDGVCDCCDGSDEWAAMTVPEHVRIDESMEKRLNMDQVPCTDRCLFSVRTGMERGLKSTP